MFGVLIEKILRFADEHRDDDPLKLLLKQDKYPEIDLRLVAQQLEGRRQAWVKWPTLARCAAYFYPPKLNREQSSSERTARYKGEIFARLGCVSFADLTGGMGIDTLFLSEKAQGGEYYEEDAWLCALARHNFAALGLGCVSVHQGDSMAAMAAGEGRCYDLIMIDPARRDSRGRKVAAFECCTPNLIEHRDAILARCRYLLVKASPMIDIDLALRQLGGAEEVHVVAVGGECKEVLFLVSSGGGGSVPRVRCIDLGRGHEGVSFTREEERTARASYADGMGRYLYEPNAALMKGGCYNSLCGWYGVRKLSRNTHLYTSEEAVEGFPGRCWAVLVEVKLTAKEVARAIPGGRAHVTTRNYPLSAEELRRRLRIEEGGELFVVAATLGERRLGWLCREVRGERSE